MDIDFDNFIDKIFTNEIKDPKTYNLSVNISNLKEIFEMLLMVFTKGMKILYGNNGVVDLKNISESEFNVVKDYFMSMGYKLIVAVYSESEYFSNNITKYADIIINKNTKLTELKLPFKSDNVIYVISFDFM